MLLIIVIFGCLNILQILHVNYLKTTLSEFQESVIQLDEEIDFIKSVKQIPEWLREDRLDGVRLIGIMSDYNCIETLEWTIPKLNLLSEHFPDFVKTYHLGGSNLGASYFGAKFTSEVISVDDRDMITNPVIALVDNNGIIHHMYEVDPFDQQDGELFIEHVESLLSSL